VASAEAPRAAAAAAAAAAGAAWALALAVAVVAEREAWRALLARWVVLVAVAAEEEEDGVEGWEAEIEEVAEEYFAARTGVVETEATAPREEL